MPSSGTVRRLNIVVSADNQASSELQQVDEEADQVAESMEEADQNVDALRESFFALAGATTAVVGSMAAMTSLGAQIDTTLATVRATSGATAEEMQMISSEIQQIGAESPVLMSDVAAAFRELSFAGFDAAESVAAVGSVVDLAVAGQMSIAQSSRIVTSNLRAFNMEAEQAGAVASAMGSTFASSALTVQELGQALEYVAPVASTAGQSVLEVSAALGVLADNGIRASRAGTGLQQFFSRLVRPTGRAEEAMSQLGLTTEDFLDEEGNFEDMNQMVATLSEEMEGMSEGEQLQVLIDLFGQRGARSVAPLIDNVEELNEKIGENAAADLKTAINDFSEMSAEEVSEIDEQVTIDLQPNMSRDAVLREIMAASEDLSQEELATQVQFAFDVDERTAEILASDIADGASVDELSSSLENATTEADIAAEQMETVGGRIEYITGSIESAAYTIYTGFRPALNVVLGLLIDLSDVITANEWALKAFGAALFVTAGGLAAMTGALGVALAQASLAGGALGGLVTSLTATATGSFALAAASRAASGALFLMTASTSQLITAAWGLVPSLSAAAGALGTLRAGLMAATTGLYSFFAALGPIGWAILAVTAALTAYSMNLFGFRDAVDAVLGPIGSLLDAVRWLGSAFLWLGEATAWILQWTGGAVLSALVWPFQALVSAIQSLVAWYGELGTLGKMVVGAFLPVLPVLWAIGEAFELLGDLAEWVGDVLTSIPEAIGDAWAGLGLWIGDQLRAATPYIRAVIDPIIALRDWIRGVGDAVSNLGDLIHNTFADIEARIASIPGMGLIFDEGPERKGEGQSLVGPMASGVEQDEGLLAGAVRDVVGTAASFLPQSDAERGPLSNLTQRGRSLLSTLASGAQREEGTLAGSVSSIAQSVMSGLRNVGTFGMGGSGMLGNLLSGLPGGDMLGGMAPGGGAGAGAGGGGAMIQLTVEVNNDFGDTSAPEQVAQATGNSVRDAADQVIQDLEDAFTMSRDAPQGVQ